MISPNTPSGTEIVCINDSVRIKEHKNYMFTHWDLDGLKKGVVYTVREVFFDEEYNDFCVRLNEILRPSNKFGVEVGYALSRFRYLDLAGLTELLDVKIDVDKDVEELV